MKHMHKIRKIFFVLLGIFILTIEFSIVMAQEKVLLDDSSAWRMFYTLKAPVVQKGKKLEAYLTEVRWQDQASADPSSDWQDLKFNDAGWALGKTWQIPATPYLDRVCLRGTFDLTNPGELKGLALSLDFHGGAIVYINGKEIARKDILKGKNIAKTYPLDAFVKKNGDLLAIQGTYLSKGRAGAPNADELSRMALRKRSITNLKIPAKILKKGLNILAIEIFRAPYNKVMLEGKKSGKERRNIFDWNTCDVQKIKLSASAPSGIAKSPDGLQIRHSDITEGNTDIDSGIVTEKLNPVKIIAAGNGTFSGKFVLGSNAPIQGLKVSVSDLKGPGGMIPSSSAHIRYGVKWGREHGLTEYGSPASMGGAKLLGMLVEKAPEQKVIPVWITVDVAADVNAGIYSGSVSVQAQGERERKVPIEIDVADWTLPDPQNYKTWVELVESPDTLAVEYDVPLWSERHFNMIGRSFDLISKTGTRVVHIPLIAHTNLGNAESMVRWIKKGKDKYEYDFSIMDKYLDIAEKHLGTPKIVVLQAWDVYMASANQKRFEDFKRTGGPIVTLIDKPDGKTENKLLPPLSDPKSKALWKKLFTQVLARLKKRGLDKVATVGMFPDMAPSVDDAKFFKSVAPSLPWVAQGHQIWKDLHGIGKIAYNSSVWGGYRFADGGKQTNQKDKPVVKSLHGWKRPTLDTVFERNNMIERFPCARWRFFAETGITSELRGVGRIGADYWKSVKNRRGKRRGWVHDRFTEGSWSGNRMNLNLCNPVLAPGPEGPESTTRLISFAEGVQECEARIVIEQALTDNAQKRKLGKDLVKRCENALDKRLLLMWRSLSNHQLGGKEFFLAKSWRWTAGIAGQHFFLGSNWKNNSKELFSLAGEVETKLGIRKKSARKVKKSTVKKKGFPAGSDDAKAAALLSKAKKDWKKTRKKDKLRSSLKKVIADFPDTKAAKSAKKLLTKFNKKYGKQ